MVAAKLSCRGRLCCLLIWDADSGRRNDHLIHKSCRIPQLPETEPGNITSLLRAWKDGDKAAEEKLWPVVYEELHRLASRFLKAERREHTLQTTALVHEAYLKFLEQRRLRFEDRSHFYAIAARIMRRILVDHARQRGAAKRGGGWQKVKIASGLQGLETTSQQLLALDEALDGLARVDEFKATLVELRFFGGLTHAEAGEVMKCSEMTVRRHWQVAKAWLRSELRGSEGTHAV